MVFSVCECVCVYDGRTEHVRYLDGKPIPSPVVHKRATMIEAVYVQHHSRQLFARRTCEMTANEPFAIAIPRTPSHIGCA